MSRPDDVLRACWLELATCRPGRPGGPGGPGGPGRPGRPGRPDRSPRLDENDASIDDLLARYGEPHRHYHTAVHIAAVLGHADLLTDRSRSVDRSVVRAAVLFHDVVYDPSSSTNEAASADYAIAALVHVGWERARVDRVAELIRATAGHVDPDEPDSPGRAVDDMDIVLDADLAILGGSPAAYAAYVAGVRREFGRVTTDQWNAGRAAVLRGLAGRRRIYRTPTMFAEREARARSNLAGELATLGSPPDDEARRG